MREVHIAGQGLQIKTRARQRCCWCGLVILDKELGGTQHEEREDGLPGETFLFYPFGQLVAIVGDTHWPVPFDPDTDTLPPDACAALDPDLTGALKPEAPE